MGKSDYESKTIKEVITSIEYGGMFLPPIQRKFVWTDEQITNLFDSIMRGYPIGTFLFWEIDKKILNEKGYTLYKFVDDYDERGEYQNKSVSKPYIEEGESSTRANYVTAVLDGQQRLTSLYLALRGTVTRKKPYARTTNDSSYITKELYFNLHSNPDGEEKIEDESNVYEFKFLSEEEFNEINTPGKCPSLNDKLWIKVKDVLQYNESAMVITKLAKAHKPRFNTDVRALENIALLHGRLVNDDVINYFNAKADCTPENEKFVTLDEISDVFVRINSGGTKLTKTDLLFSTIVSVWNDAKEKFQELVSQLNDGYKYKFDNNFVIKTCLMVTNCKCRITSEALKKSVIEEMEANWGRIRSSIVDIRGILSENGISQDCITSYNAILPLVLFRYRFGEASLTENNILEMRKFVIISQINEVFGKSSNSTLDSLRKQIIDELIEPKFPSIGEFRFKNNETIKLDREMIRSWFDRFEKGPITRIILTLLYDSYKYDEIDFDQDHMHPAAAFEEWKKHVKSIKNVCSRDEQGIAVEVSNKEEKMKCLKHQRNTLANLQILRKNKNKRKKDKPLNEWLADPENKKEAQYLPDCSYELDDFEEFMQKRQKLMEDELCRIFGVK